MLTIKINEIQIIHGTTYFPITPIVSTNIVKKSILSLKNICLKLSNKLNIHILVENKITLQKCLSLIWEIK